MGKVIESIDASIVDFIKRQHMFFVATAPSEGGHVNLSPKGYDSFTILSPSRVAYLDLTGSGAETIAHLRDDGRITIMFCAFDGKPNIVRLYGEGRALPSGSPEFDEMASMLPERRGARSIIVVDVDRVSTSCGFSVPLLDFVDERDTLAKWVDRRDDESLVDYRAEKNATSIDGLPALG